MRFPTVRPPKSLSPPDPPFHDRGLYKTCPASVVRGVPGSTRPPILSRSPTTPSPSRTTDVGDDTPLPLSRRLQLRPSPLRPYPPGTRFHVSFDLEGRVTRPGTWTGAETPQPWYFSESLPLDLPTSGGSVRQIVTREELGWTWWSDSGRTRGSRGAGWRDSRCGTRTGGLSGVLRRQQKTHLTQGGVVSIVRERDRGRERRREVERREGRRKEKRKKRKNLLNKRVVLSLWISNIFLTPANFKVAPQLPSEGDRGQ